MIGAIGIGNIGSIIIDRLLESGKFAPEEIIIFDRSAEKTLRFKPHGVIIASSGAEVCERSSFVFLAVKPQDAGDLFSQISKVDFSEKVIISTMTGIPMERISRNLGANKIVRIMPNVPCAVGRGVIGVTFSEAVSKEEFEMVENILSPLGKIVKVREKDFAAVTALSGSGPAFVFVVVEALIDSGLRMGLSYDVSRELILETLKGSAELLQIRGNHPGEFRHLVTSPGGTTIEGIYSLEREGLRGALMKALFDTYEKAKEFEELRNDEE